MVATSGCWSLEVLIWPGTQGDKDKDRSGYNENENGYDNDEDSR